MAKPKILFKSNINSLKKVSNQLRLSQTMTYSQVILGERNQQNLHNAFRKVEEAIEILNTIQ